MLQKRVIEKDTFIQWLLYFMFLTSIDTCLFGTNGNYLFRLVPRISGLVFIFSPLIKSRILRLEKSLMVLFMTMVIIQTVSSIINHELIFTYISRILFFLVAFVIVSIFSFDKFAALFVDFLYFISIIALVLEVIAYIMPNMIMSLPQVVNTEGQIFYTCFFGAIHNNSFGRLLIRSSSIFWEPGAYAVYLIFGLIIEWFCKQKFNLKHNIVFLLGLLTSFSTTGYIAVMILMIAFLCIRTEMRNQKVIKILFGVCFVFMMIFLLNPYSDLYQMVFAKIKNNSSSAITRYSSIYNGIKVALSHPLFGVASNTDIYMKEIVNAKNAMFTSGGYIITNTIIGQFACYGLIYGTLYFIGLCKFCKKIYSGKIMWISILFTIIVGFSGERFFSYFAYVWMLYGFKSEKFLKK